MIYLIGNNGLSFAKAYEVAKDGDILEFESGYNYNANEGSVKEITKNLTFKGNIDCNENGERVFNNSIYGRITITNGTNVTFENLWFDPLSDSVAIEVTDNSTLNIKTAVFNNSFKDNKRVIFYSHNSATVNFYDVNSIESKPHCIFYFKNSKLSIKDSYIRGKLDIEDCKEVDISNTTISSIDNNALVSKGSDINIENCSMYGCDIELNLPAFWASHSKIISKNNIINQYNYISALYLTNASIFDSYNDKFTSLYLTEMCLAYAKNLKLNVGLYVYDKSSLKVEQDCDIYGENNEKIEVYATNHSIVIFDNLIINRYFNPNIRVQNKSIVYTDNINYKAGTIEDLTIDLVEDSKFINSAQTSKGNNEKIHYQKNNIAPGEENPMEKLDSIIGLKQVKKEISKIIGLVEFNKQRAAQGLKQEEQALHSVFMGNPGTGKTTVARIMGRVLFDKGVLKSDEFKFEEVSQEDLVSPNVGGTAPKTREVLEKARGGVLFVDEAYNLYKKDGINHGQEAIDTIMKFMDDNRDEIVVIFAGYTKEMEQFLKSNPGLKSRTPNTFIFEDYTEAEIVEMGEAIIEKDQYQLEDREYYAKQVAREYANSLDGSNGRWIRNFNQKLTRTLANRVISTGDSNISLILNEDIDNVLKIGKFDEAGAKESALIRLNNLIGIAKVKEQVNEFIALAKVNKQRLEAGYKVEEFSLHSMFLGNPGTGKTTVARIIGDLLYQEGIIKQNKFYEVSRSDLVAGYVGQTAAKTREVLESALGGVLFIDEAYTLNGKGSNDFGQEALDEILKFMEDHRRDIVIIFAGYTKEMTEFLGMNSGLSSRIPTTFDFEDYSAEEIVEIGLYHLSKLEYQVERDTYAQGVISSFEKAHDNSNGRWIRNYNEKLIRILSRRLASGISSTDELNLITLEDLEKMNELNKY